MDALWWLSSALAVVIGLLLGWLGGGGSILTVPVLVYVVGQSPAAAVTTSLVIVGINSAFGSWLRRHSGAIQWPMAGIFGGVGVVGAILGSRFTHLVSGETLLLLFAALMLVVAGLMLRPPRSSAPAGEPIEVRWFTVGLAGLGVGVLTGFLGVGGGFLIVPALVMLLGLSMIQAIATSLPIIAINSAAGLAGHLMQGGLDWGVVVRFVSLGGIGMLLGVALARRTSPTGLRRAFAWFVIGVALYILARSVAPLV
jgi:uncharacterized protein